MKKIVIVIAFLFQLFQFGNVRADSFYSSIGLGIPQYIVTIKALGMGGAGIGVVDRLALNAMNPAANDIMGITSISAGFQYESVDNRTATSKVNTRYGNPAGFQFFIPVKHNINVIAAIRPLMISRYVLSSSQRVQDIEFTRLVRGSGGLSAASLGTQVLLKKWLFVAGMVNMNFGAYTEEWKTDFYSVSFADASDVLSSHLHGPSFELGVLLRMSRNFGFGAIYKSKSSLSAETQLTSGSYHKPEPTKSTVTYPSSVGLGFSYISTKFLFSLDYFTQFWSQYKVNNTSPDFNNTWRFGGGMEYTGSRNPMQPFMNRVSYRIGAYIGKLPFEKSRQTSVNEKFVSLGLGLPFAMNAGRIDLALEIGKRGNVANNQYEETIIRLSGSLTGGELWFQRRKR